MVVALRSAADNGADAHDYDDDTTGMEVCITSGDGDDNDTAEATAFDDEATGLLYEAAYYGRASLVAGLVRAGADADAKRGLALRTAADRGHAAAARALLDAGADVDACGGDALVRAVAGRHTCVVSVLLEHGARVDARGTDMVCALLACLDHSADVRCALLVTRALGPVPPDALSKDAHVAVRRHVRGPVAAVLREWMCADPGRPVAALCEAAYAGDDAGVAARLALDLPQWPPAARAEASCAALCAASGAGAPACVRRLLQETGAEDDGAALIAAARGGHAPVLEALLARFAYPNHTRDVALREAAGTGRRDAVDAVLRSWRADYLPRTPARGYVYVSKRNRRGEHRAWKDTSARDDASACEEPSLEAALRAAAAADLDDGAMCALLRAGAEPHGALAAHLRSGGAPTPHDVASVRLLDACGRWPRDLVSPRASPALFRDWWWRKRAVRRFRDAFESLRLRPFGAAYLGLLREMGEAPCDAQAAGHLVRVHWECERLRIAADRTDRRLGDLRDLARLAGLGPAAEEAAARASGRRVPLDALGKRELDAALAEAVSCLGETLAAAARSDNT